MEEFPQQVTVEDTVNKAEETTDSTLSGSLPCGQPRAESTIALGPHRGASIFSDTIGDSSLTLTSASLSLVASLEQMKQ